MNGNHMDKFNGLFELIAKKEEEISLIALELERPEVYSDYKKVTELQDKSNALQTELDAFSDEWLTLSEELEQ